MNPNFASQKRRFPKLLQGIAFYPKPQSKRILRSYVFHWGSSTPASQAPLLAQRSQFFAIRFRRCPPSVAHRALPTGRCAYCTLTCCAKSAIKIGAFYCGSGLSMRNGFFGEIDFEWAGRMRLPFVVCNGRNRVMAGIGVGAFPAIILRIALARLHVLPLENIFGIAADCLRWLIRVFKNPGEHGSAHKAQRPFLKSDARIFGRGCGSGRPRRHGEAG